MRSPADLKQLLRRQWDISPTREARLLGYPGAWPLQLPIGRPSPRILRDHLDDLKRHIAAWRGVKTGEVLWRPIQYRQAAEPINVPLSWILTRPSEWIDAMGDSATKEQFHRLSQIVGATPAIFHSFFVRQRAVWGSKSPAEVIQAARIAMALAPGSAAGLPLRALSIEGSDTKFFERHGSLITALLDLRFDGEASRVGLETFLDAARDGDHWLLVVDLDGSLLPFQKLRVRCRELRHVALPGDRLLIVENESCQHLVPRIPGTVAVFGAGFDLSWMEGEWLRSKRVGYWGDLDTWGLQFLAAARSRLPSLEALLMSAIIYERYRSFAVPEPVAAAGDVPEGLLEEEAQLYRCLLEAERGRLEQEFLPPGMVHEQIEAWAATLPIRDE